MTDEPIRFCPFCKNGRRATVKLEGHMTLVLKLTRRKPLVSYVCADHIGEGVARVRGN